VHHHQIVFHDLKIAHSCKCVGTQMIPLHTKFHMPSLIVTAIKPKATLIKNNRKSSFRGTDTYESTQSIGYING
jgi:hypothetical protein